MSAQTSAPPGSTPVKLCEQVRKWYNYNTSLYLSPHKRLLATCKRWPSSSSAAYHVHWWSKSMQLCMQYNSNTVASYLLFWGTYWTERRHSVFWCEQTRLLKWTQVIYVQDMFLFSVTSCILPPSLAMNVHDQPSNSRPPDKLKRAVLSKKGNSTITSFQQRY